MPSPFFSTLQRASQSAQSIFAQMQGMEADAAGNFLYHGETYTGVFGSTQLVDVPTAGGGYRRQALLTLTATRDQFAAAPQPKGKLTRTDVSPQIEYLVQAIDVHDALHYTFSLVKNGA